MPTASITPSATAGSATPSAPDLPDDARATIEAAYREMDEAQRAWDPEGTVAYYDSEVTLGGRPGSRESWTIAARRAFDELKQLELEVGANIRLTHITTIAGFTRLADDRFAVRTEFLSRKVAGRGVYVEESVGAGKDLWIYARQGWRLKEREVKWTRTTVNGEPVEEDGHNP
ncbi:MAG: hypothetical protein HY319_00105 [Armatimonadetes bacterium]|nr:hypothetical protein [Armatimonadota bacterium]